MDQWSPAWRERSREILVLQRVTVPITVLPLLCVPQKENTPHVSCGPHDPANSVSRHDLLKICDEPTGSMPGVHQVEEAQGGSMEEVASASLSPS